MTTQFKNIADAFPSGSFYVISDFQLRSEDPHADVLPAYSHRSYDSRSEPPRHYGHVDRINPAKGSLATTPVAERWYDIKYTETGDYGGHGLIGESNRRVLEQMIGESKIADDQWSIMHGSYGSCVLLLRGDVDDQDLIEAVCGLSEYPLLKEDDHSELETEKQNEAWDDDAGRGLFRKIGMEIDLDDDLIYAIEDLPEFLDALYSKLYEAEIYLSDFCTDEYGSIHVDVDRMFNAVRENFDNLSTLIGETIQGATEITHEITWRTGQLRLIDSVESGLDYKAASAREAGDYDVTGIRKLGELFSELASVCKARADAVDIRLGGKTGDAMQLESACEARIAALRS